MRRPLQIHIVVQHRFLAHKPVLSLLYIFNAAKHSTDQNSPDHEPVLLLAYIRNAAKPSADQNISNNKKLDKVFTRLN